MKNIQLTQGKFAIVDDADYEEINKFKWRFLKCGCVGRTRYIGTINGVQKKETVYLHRIISRPEKHLKVDHINGDRLDNRRQNLRNCTHQQNICNQKISLATSKYKGVSWRKRDSKWQVAIKSNGKSVYLGYFDSELEAANAYNNEAKRLHEEFARLNDVAI